ncbi:type II secretion system F family protein [Kroppenstedtia pulmonis]|uniref:Type II secretion system F family protein n=1 Tax=Kroppenstedtia pulmonis TaxID=1380685 RepID=A0A7D4BKF1_9BACL|nr:type II secretion system F family protein [Kroppenstedtia pulmonis]QKG84850.1 type II secretion system F family protein [Kroppenstedtia pulmonis]
MIRDSWKDDRLALFSRHLSNLMESGFPLLPSIRLLAEQQIIRREEAEGICSSLDQGKSFSESLSLRGFPSLFVSFLKAAEEHGDYVFGLKQCESYYRERGQLTRDLIQALTYPTVVFLLVAFAFFFLVTTVIPRFGEMYDTMGLTLPLYTRLLLSFFSVFRYVLYGVGGLVCLSAFLYLVIRRLPPDKRKVRTSWLFRLPVVKAYYALRFTHYLSIQMGSLLRSGVPLLRTVDIMHALAPWHPLAAGISRIRNRLLAGESLHRSIQIEGSLFLPSLHRLVALGEESGRLDQSFLTLAEGTEMMIRDRMNRITRSLEPVLIFIIGLLMAVTVIAMFLPMLNLVRAL